MRVVFKAKSTPHPTLSPKGRGFYEVSFANRIVAKINSNFL